MSSFRIFSCRSPRLVFLAFILFLFVFQGDFFFHLPSVLDWFRDHQPSTHTCITIDTSGCPVPHLATSSHNCPVKREKPAASSVDIQLSFEECRHPIDIYKEDIDEIDRCRETFGEWFSNKYGRSDSTFLTFSTTAATNFLSDASCVLLLRDMDTLQRLINYHFFCKTTISSTHISHNFTKDLHDEIRDAIAIYFSAFWQNHPFFRKTLPDNHHLFIPPETIIDPNRKRWREGLKESILSEGQYIPRKLRRPRLLIIAGGGASGKSSVLSVLKSKRKLIPPGAHILINPDNIKLLDPIYQAITSYGDMRAADVVHKESNIIAEELFLEALNRRYEIIYDGTFSDYERGSRMVEIAQKHGYDVVMVGVTVDPALALKRSLERAARSKRVVPSQDLLRAHKMFSRNFEKYLQIVDKALLCETYREHTNSSTKINILASLGSDRRLKIFNEVAYREFLAKSTLNEFAEWEHDLNLNTRSPSLTSLDMEKWFLRCTWSPSQVPRYLRVMSAIEPRLDEYCLCNSKPIGYSIDDGMISPNFATKTRMTFESILRGRFNLDRDNQKKRRRAIRRRKRPHP